LCLVTGKVIFPGLKPHQPIYIPLEFGVVAMCGVKERYQPYPLCGRTLNVYESMEVIESESKAQQLNMLGEKCPFTNHHNKTQQNLCEEFLYFFHISLGLL